MCVDGARAVLKSILQAFPKTDISLSVIWIQMPGFNDNEKTAQRSAGILNDPRVRHFYDPYPTHRAGRAFAKGVIAEGRGPAWDIYMFYKKGETWDDGPPLPVEFAHQLSGGKRADPARFRTGTDLVDALHELMHKVTGDACTGS